MFIFYWHNSAFEKILFSRTTECLSLEALNLDTDPEAGQHRAGVCTPITVRAVISFLKINPLRRVLVCHST